VLFFWSETCHNCHEVMEEFLPPVAQAYGDQLEILYVETSDPAHYELYLAALEAYDVPPVRQGVPALFIGKTHLVGAVEIPEKLVEQIDRHLDRGGLAYPEIEGLETLLLETAAEGGSQEGGDDSEPIYLAYLYQTGCQDCDRVKGDLDYLRGKYPQIVVDEFNVRENTVLAEWLGERAGVPTLRRLTAPTIFVGDDYLLEEDLEASSLEELLIKYAPTGTERYWENWEATGGAEAQQSIVERFASFGVLTVVLAGLLDGLNPCAFATMIFFVSYLTISGRKGKEILLVGGAFTLGVFVAYTGVGLGFYQVLSLLGDLLAQLGRWLYGLTGVGCLILAVISFADYRKARRGQIGDMSLNLPHNIRMRINATIRKGRKSRAFVAGAFVTGVVVSFLELACTGQVYLPVILFVTSQPDLRAQGTLFLLIYNLLFILPLVVVFLLAYYGTGAKQLSDFLQERAATVKLGLTLLFFALGSWLLVSLLWPLAAQAFS
jgi:cytochrome c biogenesis protein CcdA